MLPLNLLQFYLRSMKRTFSFVLPQKMGFGTWEKTYKKNRGPGGFLMFTGTESFKSDD